MAGQTLEQRVVLLFAEILQYPRPGLVEAVQECEALVLPWNPEAAARLDEFLGAVVETPLGRLEEIYTGTFDLDTTCYPYVGYHLFGESYKRSVFLLGLKERYQACGIVIGSELPDHLALVLRFLAASDDREQVKELIDVALLPTLERLVTETDGEAGEQVEPRSSRKLYQPVLQALQLVLQRRPLPQLLAPPPSRQPVAGAGRVGQV